MALRIVSADERLSAKQKVSLALFGGAGVGKTTQAQTLNPDTTLFIDLEAGTLALGQWKGDVIDVHAESSRMGIHPWDFSRGLACWIGGADPAETEGPYCQASFDTYCEVLGDPKMLEKYDTIFIDSITVASRHSFSWAEKQPEAFSEKTGKPDIRGAYGLHGREMIKWLTSLQHQPKSVIVVGILDEVKDEFERTIYKPQIVGSMAGNQLPGIFDQVVTLASMELDDGTQYRCFVTHQMNPWSYPAKDRSGCLDLQEPPDLGALMRKIESGKRVDQTVTTIPSQKLDQKDTPTDG